MFNDPKYKRSKADFAHLTTRQGTISRTEKLAAGNNKDNGRRTCSSSEHARERRTRHANILGRVVETVAKRTATLITLLNCLGVEHLAVARMKPLEHVSFFHGALQGSKEASKRGRLDRRYKYPHAHKPYFQHHSTFDCQHIPFSQLHLFLSPVFSVS